ncbi:hypothetical protein ABIB57_004442 [Devosia sp. UYZn731]
MAGHEAFPVDQPLPASLDSTTMTVTSVLPLQGVLRIETKDGSLLVTLDRIGAASPVSG